MVEETVWKGEGRKEKLAGGEGGRDGGREERRGEGGREREGGKKLRCKRKEEGKPNQREKLEEEKAQLHVRIAAVQVAVHLYMAVQYICCMSSMTKVHIHTTYYMLPWRLLLLPGCM